MDLTFRGIPPESAPHGSLRGCSCRVPARPFPASRSRQPAESVGPEGASGHDARRLELSPAPGRKFCDTGERPAEPEDRDPETGSCAGSAGAGTITWTDTAREGFSPVPYLPAGQSPDRLFFPLPGGGLWSRRAMSRNPPTIPAMRSSSRFCQSVPRTQDLQGMGVSGDWPGQGPSRTMRRSAWWPVGGPDSASSHPAPTVPAMRAAALAMSGRLG